ncbi:LemA family protein [Magnetococcales bacterium HHB-1]
MEDLEKFDIEEVTRSERHQRMKKLMRQLHEEELAAQRLRLPPIGSRSIILFFSITSILVFGVTTLYNFNRFVLLEERVLSSHGHVEDALQRRQNLFGNLINLALNQSALEQEVFRHVADVRRELMHEANQRQLLEQKLEQTSMQNVKQHGAQSPPAQKDASPQMSSDKQQTPSGTSEKTVQVAKETAGGKGALPLSGMVQQEQALKLNQELMAMFGQHKNGVAPLSKLLAVVEQYPNIKTADTYRQVMEQLMDLENRIAMRRDEYNEEVRIYNTLISSFPWYILAKTTGFERYDYFSLSTGEEKPPILSPKTFNRLLPVLPSRPGTEQK